MTEVAETRHCDVVVVGSGAAGLATAVAAACFGLDVVVIEKEPVFGGTSAWSGGWLWIPRNPLARRAGINEPESEPLRYLESEIGNRIADPRIRAFLANGPEMVSFFEDNTAVQWIDGNSIPDFHETPGSAKGGRSVSAKPYDGRQLGADIARLRPPLDLASVFGMGIAGGADMTHFFNARRKLASARHVARRLARHLRDLALHGRAMQLVNGNALIARLMRSALDRGVTLWEATRITRLIDEDGRIAGAEIRRNGQTMTVRAARGAVLATGGFPHDKARMAALFDHTDDGSGHYSAASFASTGDGLRLGESAGGTVTDDYGHAGAWSPVSLVPRGDGSFGHFPHLVERAKPGFIAVNRFGRRFVNEAESYHDFVKAMFADTPAGEEPFCWLVADHRAQRRFGLGWAKPFPFALSRYHRCGYLKSGRTLADLATACSLPVDALAETVARFNADARAGADSAFGRGSSAYNRIQGDADNQPNPALGPLERAPFHAVRIVPGSLGTFAGLKTDPHARVLDQAGQPVDGLFAVGNDMASIFGGNYPSGGITLGPGMTFGYIAARTLAGLPVTGLDAVETAIERQGVTP